MYRNRPLYKPMGLTYGIIRTLGRVQYDKRMFSPGLGMQWCIDIPLRIKLLRTTDGKIKKYCHNNLGEYDSDKKTTFYFYFFCMITQIMAICEQYHSKFKIILDS